MHDFIERITAYVHWALFLLLEVLSGFLLFRYNHYQGSIWLTQANTAVAKVHEWEAGALSYLRMPAENAALVRRNIILQNKLDVLRHELVLAKADTSQTQKALEDLLEGMTLIPAQIVDNSVRKRDNMLVINAGSDEGVAPEMGVVSGTGVVGIVSAVTPQAIESIHGRRASPCTHPKGRRRRDKRILGSLPGRHLPRQSSRNQE